MVSAGCYWAEVSRDRGQAGAHRDSLPHGKYHESSAELIASVTPEQLYSIVSEDCAFSEVAKKSEFRYPGLQVR